eukprot:gene7694-858_t
MAARAYRAPPGASSDACVVVGVMRLLSALVCVRLLCVCLRVLAGAPLRLVCGASRVGVLRLRRRLRRVCVFFWRLRSAARRRRSASRLRLRARVSRLSAARGGLGRAALRLSASRRRLLRRRLLGSVRLAAALLRLRGCHAAALRLRLSSSSGDLQAASASCVLRPDLLASLICVCTFCICVCRLQIDRLHRLLSSVVWRLCVVRLRLPSASASWRLRLRLSSCFCILASAS